MIFKGMVIISIIGGGGYKIIRICSAVCKKMISLMQSVCLPICPQPFWLQRSEEQHSKHIVRWSTACCSWWLSLTLICPEWHF